MSDTGAPKTCRGQKSVFTPSPLSCWIGGKYLLAGRIVPLIPRHQCYCEPFFGAGWVLFKKQPSPVEVANDINGEVINCWRMLRDRPEELKERIDWTLCSRLEFDELVRMTPEEVAAMTDVERAWRLLYILKCSFGGRDVANVAGGNCGGSRPAFGFSRTSKDVYYPDGKPGKAPSFHCLKQTIARGIERVSRVVFEHGDYERALALYDHERTFFYLDPPYLGSDNYYGGGFDLEEHCRLLGNLQKLKGRFILSMNDHPAIREIYRGFRLHGVKTPYSLNRKARELTASELLVSNYDFDESLMARYDVRKI